MISPLLRGYCMCSVPKGGLTAGGQDTVLNVAEAVASVPATYSAIIKQFIWLG